MDSFKKIKIRKKIGMTIFAGVYQDLAPTAFSGKKVKSLLHAAIP